MPDQGRRDRYQRQQRYQAYTDENSHPFLTPRGLRLQQQLPAEPIPMPAVTPGWIQLDSDLQPGIPPALSRTPPSPEELHDQLMQNVKPSLGFADPMELRTRPLTDLFQTRLVSQNEREKLKAIGKLRMQFSADPMKPAAVGSAWVAGPSLIVTAAHNVFDSNTRRWARRVEFQPGFDYYGETPKQWFSIAACAIPNRYRENPITNADVAYLYCEQNIGDMIPSTIPIEPLSSLSMFDEEPVDIIGYPAGSRFDFGKQLWRSRGQFLFGHRSGPRDAFGPVLATDFGGGASGCPWIVVRDGQPKAIGVTSGHGKLGYGIDEPNLMSLTSPYFGENEIEDLFNDQEYHQFI